MSEPALRGGSPSRMAPGLIPTFNWPKERLLLLMAGGKDALLRSAENAEDETGQAIRAIQQNAIGAPDVVIAVAASGRLRSR